MQTERTATQKVLSVTKAGREFHPERRLGNCFPDEEAPKSSKRGKKQDVLSGEGVWALHMC